MKEKYTGLLDSDIDKHIFMQEIIDHADKDIGEKISDFRKEVLQD